MNLRRTFAITRRIAAQFRRDRRTLGLLFVAPVVLLGLLSWVIRDQSPPPARLAVVNLAGDLGEQARTAIVDVAAGEGLTVERDINDDAAARAALRDGTLDVVLVLPESFPAEIAAGQAPTLRVVTPGIDPSDDGARLAELQQVMGAALGGGQLPMIARETVFGSTEGEYFDAFAPPLVGFFAFFLVFILTGVSFLRERVGGTLERLLATPIRRSEIVAGYSVGFGFFATLQVAVILAFTLGNIDVPAIGPLPAFSVGLGVANAGSPLLAFAVTLLLALGAVNLGIFLSTFARTELQIIQFIPIVVVPQGLLSGVLVPVASLPEQLQAAARVLPLTYAVDGLREVLIKGADIGSGALQLDLAVLAAISILLVILATATIRREVA
jgi:ABC-2 type transport system permease protein